MSQMIAEPQMFGFAVLAVRWGVSKITLHRLAKSGDLRTVNIAGRRLVPRSEVERAEREGIGNGRKRKTSAQ